MNVTTLIEPDIIRVNRPSDYDFDVTMNGEWIASAKNYHNADDVATEVWYRAVLDQPLADVNWNSSADAQECTIDCPGCAACTVEGGPGGIDLYAAAFADEPGLCACGAVATLAVHLGGHVDHVCGLCFMNDYENNYEDSRSWIVEPLATEPPADPLPSDGPGDPIPGDPGYEYPRAKAAHGPKCLNSALPVPSFYALLVAECQAELDARMAEPAVMVMDVDFAPVGWAA